MRKYIVLLESGKNNISGCQLHIQKTTMIMSAENIDSAYEEAMKKKADRWATHYGHNADYYIITDIKTITD